MIWWFPYRHENCCRETFWGNMCFKHKQISMGWVKANKSKLFIYSAHFIFREGITLSFSRYNFVCNIYNHETTTCQYMANTMKFIIYEIIPDVAALISRNSLNYHIYKEVSNMNFLRGNLYVKIARVYSFLY